MRDPFNNKDYNGEYCEKILKNVDSLEEIVDKTYSPIIEALRSLWEIKKSCFEPELQPNYKTAISKFERAWYDIYLDFDIPFSNKCHIIIEHIPQVIERTGKSLFLSSEQVVEACHAKFDKMWQRYKVLDL